MKIALDLKALWKGLPLVVVVILGIVVMQGGVWFFRAMVSAIASTGSPAHGGTFPRSGLASRS